MEKVKNGLFLKKSFTKNKTAPVFFLNSSSNCPFTSSIATLNSHPYYRHPFYALNIILRFYCSTTTNDEWVNE